MFADLTRICQEAATNAIKHGKADRIEIAYRAGPEDVSLHIKDNGKSVQAMGKGLGLGGMAERADNLFGDLAYGFAAGGGFFVRVDAPVIPEEEPWAET
jgi:signal transduction histidine kinase